ncbi:permease [Pseudoalteromonas lipolytica SCSIO 04301]|uniref:permease n=1 Tax=Pseudoalteromonas TaxID=53246 RepID=UPI00044AB790|nr:MULTISPECIES: permease [Pseudoalteromonas]EWH04301.1 permease [Pseudoalteromonas lipolytica SCSIO 04301]MCC9662657.1 permease [Pseudoalteromonas sp. MB41]HCV03821.1 permease [Pseudoalteromonas sp.]|tara:strand:+ start:1767 stop:2681 length:915 start_codon:yes stop_codon:yes gene_type:complete
MNITEKMVFDTLNMFGFLAVELTLLFLAISYFVGLLQEYIPPAKIQSILGSKNGKGYFVASFLGAITPFCSCSTIPFLKGLLRAKAGFGTMMVFLFASPLLNPIIIGLFAVTFGIQVTLFYFAIAMGVSIIAGVTLEKLGFEKYVKPEAYIEPEKTGCGSACGGETKSESKWVRIWKSTWSDFKKVLPYLIGGIAIGSLIYGFMPTELVAKVASEENPFAIPFAAVIGVPLYIRAEAVIPLSAALAAKGMGLGAVMALIIGSAGASLTEVILLKSIFKNTMIFAFLIVILSMAISAGFLYQFIF